MRKKIGSMWWHVEFMKLVDVLHYIIIFKGDNILLLILVRQMKTPVSSREKISLR